MKFTIEITDVEEAKRVLAFLSGGEREANVAPRDEAKRDAAQEEAAVKDAPPKIPRAKKTVTAPPVKEVVEGTMVFEEEPAPSKKNESLDDPLPDALAPREEVKPESTEPPEEDKNWTKEMMHEVLVRAYNDPAIGPKGLRNILATKFGVSRINDVPQPRWAELRQALGVE